MNEGRFASVRDEEIKRVELRIAKQTLADARAVIATEEGRRLIHRIVYELGGLQKVLPDEPQGRRALATAIYYQLDMANPGCVERIALEARKQRIADDALIESAIADRRHEYE